MLCYNYISLSIEYNIELKAAAIKIYGLTTYAKGTKSNRETEWKFISF